jgi:hypothetical protein
MRAKVFNFPEPAKPGLVPVMVEVPASSLTYEVDAYTAIDRWSVSFFGPEQ